jgi:hypothetical protein
MTTFAIAMIARFILQLHKEGYDIVLVGHSLGGECSMNVEFW